MSKLFSLQAQDFVKGLIIAIFAPVVIYLGQVLQAATTGGTFLVDWGMLVKLGLSAGIAYIVKNYITNSQGQVLSSEPKTPSA